MFPVDSKNIKLIVYDFDGVMTNNRVIVDQNGVESVIVNRGDGYGVSLIKKLGIQQIILSTEKNLVVTKRAEKLDVPVLQGSDNKITNLKAYLKENEILPEKVLYIGNDLNDWDCLNYVGYKMCPRDAEPEIRDICDYVFTSGGGEGVIRELYRLLTK